MGIFSSIGNAISSAYNSVKSAVSNVFSGGGSSQSASAINAISSNPSSQTSYKNLMTPNPSGSAYQPTPNIPYTQLYTPVPSGANYSASTYSSVPYDPQLPVTISANKTQSSGGGSPANSLLSSSSFSAPTTITSSSLRSSSSGASPLALPFAPTGVNPGNINTTGLAGTVSDYYKRNPDGTFELVQDNKNIDKTKEDTIREQKDLYDSIFGKPTSVYDDPQVIRARNERERIQQALRAPTSELNAIIAKQNQDLLQLRQTGAQEGVTEAVYGGQANAINYNAAIRALPLQASIASLQGDLKLAQDYLTELTQIKSEQIKSQYEYNKGLFTAISGAIDKEDTRQYEAMKTANERAYNEQKDLIKIQNELLQSAVSQNAPQSVINGISNANNSQGAILAAGQYAGNIQDRLYKQAQIEKLIADTNEKKASNDVIQRISQIDFNSPTYITDMIMASSGGAKLTGDQTKPISKALTVVGQIDSLQKSLEGQKTGPIIGILRSSNPYDVQAQLIKAQLQAIIPNLARGVYGEVGVLTDNDIANYRQTIGNIKTTKQANDLLLSMTLKTIQNGINDQLEVLSAAGRDVSGFLPVYNRLDQRISEINSNIGIQGTPTPKANSADLDYINSLSL